MTEPLRIGVAGAGWWASAIHLPALAADPAADLVGVYDPDESRVRAAVARVSGLAGFTELDDLLSEVDALVVATPHDTHHRVGTAALAAGCHVLVEKPMATTAVDAWDLVGSARSRGLVLAAGLTYQYSATASRVADLVRYEIGDLVCVNAEFSSGTLGLFATTDPADADLDRPEVPHGTTYSNPISGGGQGHTQLCHILGAMMWAIGRQAVSVSGFTDNRGLAVDVVDALAFRLDGDVLGTVTSTGTTPRHVPVRHRIRFHGTDGMVEWDLLEARAECFGNDATTVSIAPERADDTYRAVDVAPTFVRVVRGEAANPGPADLAAAAVSLVDAGYRAAASGDRTPVLRGTVDDHSVRSQPG